MGYWEEFAIPSAWKLENHGFISEVHPRSTWAIAHSFFLPEGIPIIHSSMMIFFHQP